MQATLQILTSWGTIVVKARNGVIFSCDLPFVEKRPRNEFVITKTNLSADAPKDRATLKQAEAFIRSLLGGAPATLPELELPAAPTFTLKAWRAMQKIPPGSTVTYGELARRAGSPGASRAAGQACARNTLPLFIPCHRILAGNSRIGGFSAGRAWKELLLETEGRKR